MIKPFMTTLLVTAFLSVENCAGDVAPQTTFAAEDLRGDWELKNVFLGDVVDAPCGLEAKDAKGPTIRFALNEAGAEAFTGKSVVNAYGGTYQISGIDKATNIGSITFSGIYATKMAGPDPLMQCESRYFNLLENSVDFRILTENGVETLQIGHLKKDDVPSRDGGTFLIFQRVKI